MTAKSILRFLIGYLIASILMAVMLPLIGIPRAELLPPPLVYNNASGEGKGIILKKIKDYTGNPFHTGDRIYLVQYAFRTNAPQIRGSANEPGKSARYYGLLNIESQQYDALKVGDIVSVKFEKTYPDINGLTQPDLGRSGGPGSTIWSGWWAWFAIAIVLGYVIAPLLERVMLRESY